MRKIFRGFIILLCLLFLTACQPDTSAVNDLPTPSNEPTVTAEATPTPTPTPEATPRPVYTPDKEDVQLWDAETPLSGTLYLDNSREFAYTTFDEDIAAFLALHPDVKIQYPKLTYDADDVIQQFGDGLPVDVLSLAQYGFLDYVDKGKLVDLRQYMEADPAFNMDDYYTNVFDAYIYKGGQYVFPLSFSYEMAAIDKEAAPELVAEFAAMDSITLPQMMDMFARSGLEGQKHMLGQAVFDQLVNYIIARDFLDYENKTCDFDNERFVALLTSTRAVFEEKLVNPAEAMRWYYDRRDLVDFERRDHVDKYLFMRATPLDKQYFYPGFYATNIVTEPIPIVNEYGEIPIYTTDLFGIAADSPNKALAWEFIKYLASEEVQSRREFGEPLVNRAAFAAAEANTIDIFLQNDAYFNPDMTPPEGDPAAMTAAAIATHDKWNQMPMMTYSGMYRTVLNPVYTAIDMYLYNAYTPEQVAAAAQEGASAALEALK